jgi:hypothetical protein
VSQLRKLTKFRDRNLPAQSDTENREFNAFWKDIYKGTPVNVINTPKPLTNLNLEQIRDIIRHLPTSKAAGPDRIYGEAIIYGGDAAAALVIRLLNRIWKEQKVPTDM